MSWWVRVLHAAIQMSHGPGTKKPRTTHQVGLGCIVEYSRLNRKLATRINSSTLTIEPQPVTVGGVARRESSTERVVSLERGTGARLSVWVCV